MMNAATILPTQNPAWGFWGTAGRDGYDQELTWAAASDALATVTDASPAEIRDLLDARFGRQLADDLSFIPGGPVSHEAIEAHLQARLAAPGWRRWVAEALAEVRRRAA